MESTLSPQKATNMQIVKWQKPVSPPNPDAFILAMFLMFCRAPRKDSPEPDGFYSLGEIGVDAEKTWSRLTPYSIARREP